MMDALRQGESADGAPAHDHVIPLCVDLDGTLLDSDLLVEAGLAFVRANCCGRWRRWAGWRRAARSG